MKSNIPTWTERCEKHLDHQSGMVTNAMIQMRMQEEIDDLRAENEQLLAVAQGDARMLAAYHKWCEMNGFAPSSSDLSAARAALAEQEEKP